MKIGTFPAKVYLKDGKKGLKFQQSVYQQNLVQFEEGEEVMVKIYKARSLPKNDIFHAWVRRIALETGETFTKTKMDLACEYFGCTEYHKNGKIYLIPASTSEASDEEFTKALAGIHQWALEFLGLDLNYII